MNTSTVKEALEEKIKSYFAGWSEDSEYGSAVKPNLTTASLSDCYDIARHFCKFGIIIAQTLIGAQLYQAKKDSLTEDDVAKILWCFYKVNKDMREGVLNLTYDTTEYYEEILRRYQKGEFA